MKYEVAKLSGDMLDLAAALACGWRLERPETLQIEKYGVRRLCGHAPTLVDPNIYFHPTRYGKDFAPLLDELEFCIGTYPITDATWEARDFITEIRMRGYSPQEAVCRCAVAYIYGDFIDIPIGEKEIQ